MARVHVTSIAPPNIVDEVVNTFVVAARTLGHDVSYHHAGIRHDSLNIVCFALGLDAKALEPYAQRIVLNFEPLAPNTQAHFEQYLNLLRSNYVWDYSLANLKMYPELGIPHGFHVPLGHEDEADVIVPLEDRPPESELDIDVLFFGGPNARREAVLQRMRDLGLRVVTNGNMLWPHEHRDAMIRRAKVVLNMHRFDNVRIVEMPRLSMLLRRRKAVVCELYPDSEIEPALRDAVAGAEYDGLAEAAAVLVASPARRQQLEARGPDILRRFPHTDFLRKGFDDYFAWRDSKRSMQVGKQA